MRFTSLLEFKEDMYGHQDVLIYCAKQNKKTVEKGVFRLSYGAGKTAIIKVDGVDFKKILKTGTMEGTPDEIIMALKPKFDVCINIEEKDIPVVMVEEEPVEYDDEQTSVYYELGVPKKKEFTVNGKLVKESKLLSGTAIDYEFTRSKFTNDAQVDGLYLEYTNKPTLNIISNDLKIAKNSFKEGSEYNSFTPVKGKAYYKVNGWNVGWKVFLTSDEKYNLNTAEFDEPTGKYSKNNGFTFTVIDGKIIKDEKMVKESNSNDSKWDKEVFAFDNGKIETMTYGEWCKEYGSDETTSPRGVAPRLHIREKENEVYFLDGKEFSSKDDLEEYIDDKYTDDNYNPLPNTPDIDDIEPEIKITYQIWTWGVGGNHPKYTGTEFNTIEEAEEDLMEHFEFNAHKSDQSSSIFDTEEEAQVFLDEMNKGKLVKESKLTQEDKDLAEIGETYDSLVDLRKLISEWAKKKGWDINIGRVSKRGWLVNGISPEGVHQTHEIALGVLEDYFDKPTTMLNKFIEEIKNRPE